MKHAWMPRLIAGSAIALMVACNGGPKDPKTGDDATSGGATGKSGGLVGNEAPELTTTPLAGDGPKSLSEARGQIVIVDFWATFCDPCRKSFPKYQELVDKYAGDLTVIAVSVDDPDDVTEEEVKKFAEDLGVSFPIVWDKEKKTAAAYEPPKMPTSYIIDKQGVVKHIHAGFEGGEAEVIDKEVAALLGQ
jgi:cytochrome c biogenesis protein CcmG, thiol:disulfide interchange protein DsbE